MIWHSIFGLPAARRFYDPDTGGGGGGVPGGETATLDSPDSGNVGALDAIAPLRTPQERVEGEKPPDFSKLKIKTPGSEPKAEEAAGGADDSPAPEAPKKEEKGTGGAPESGKPAKKEEPKPAETTKSEAKKPEEVKKTEETKKPEAKKEETKKLPSEKEIDAMQAPKGMSPENVKGWEKLKEATKAAVKANREAQAEIELTKKEVESLKAQVGKPPPEVEKELNDHREFRRVVEAENHPEFVKEYADKITAIETNLLTFLEKDQGLKPAVIAEIKKYAEENGGNIEAWPRWNELLEHIKDPIDKQQIIDLRYKRRATLQERQQRIGELAKDKEKFFGNIQEREQQKRLEWAKVIQDKSIELAAPHDWLQPKDVPTDANDEQKKAIAEHNKRAEDGAKQFQENVKNTWFRDGPKTAEVAFKAILADYLEAELETKTTENDKLTARVRELEDRLAKIKNAGRVGHIETPPTDITKDPDKKTTVEPGRVGGDGREAISKFFSR